MHVSSHGVRFLAARGLGRKRNLRCALSRKTFIPQPAPSISHSRERRCGLWFGPSTVCWWGLPASSQSSPDTKPNSLPSTVDLELNQKIRLLGSSHVCASPRHASATNGARQPKPNCLRTFRGGSLPNARCFVTLANASGKIEAWRQTSTTVDGETPWYVPPRCRQSQRPGL